MDRRALLHILGAAGGTAALRPSAGRAGPAPAAGEEVVVRVADYLPASGRAAVRAGTGAYDCAQALLAMRADILARAAAGVDAFRLELDAGLYSYTHNGWLIGLPDYALVGQGARLRCVSSSPWHLHQNCLILNPPTTCLSGDSSAFHGHVIATAPAGAHAVVLKDAAHAASYAEDAWVAVYSLSKMIPSAGEADPWRLDFARVTGVAGATLTLDRALTFEHSDDLPVSPSTGTGPARVFRMSGAVVPPQAPASVGHPYIGFANAFGEAGFEGVEFVRNPNQAPHPHYDTYVLANGRASTVFRRCRGPELVPSYGGRVLAEDCDWGHCEPDKMTLETVIRRGRVGQLRNAAGMRRVALDGVEADLLPADCEELACRDVSLRNAGHDAGRALWFGYGRAALVAVQGGRIACDRLVASGAGGSLALYGKALHLDGAVVAYTGGKLVIPATALGSGRAHTDVATWLGACKPGSVMEWARVVDGHVWPIATWAPAKSRVLFVRQAGGRVEIALDHRGAAPQSGWRALLPHYDRLELHGVSVESAAGPVIPFRGDHANAEDGVVKLEAELSGPAHLLAPRGLVDAIEVEVSRAYGGPDPVCLARLVSRGDPTPIDLVIDAKAAGPRRISTEGSSLHANDLYSEAGIARMAITRGLFSGSLYFHPAAHDGNAPGSHAPTGGPAASVRIRIEYTDLL